MNVSQAISEFNNKFHLRYIWRKLHPKLREFTWFNSDLSIASRLDKFYIFSNLVQFVFSSSISPHCFSEYDSVALVIDYPNCTPHSPGISDGTINGNTLKQVNVSECTLNNNGISNDNSPLNNNGISNDHSITEHSDNIASNASESMVLLLLPPKWSLRILVLPVRLKWTMNLSKDANGRLMMAVLVMTSLHFGRM